MGEKLSYEEWVPKFVEALRRAEADGVRQIVSWLGRPDGCRCAEGVVADVLVAEGVLQSRGDEKNNLMEYRINKLGHRYMSASLDPAFHSLFGQELVVPVPHRYVSLWHLNDNDGLTFGQIADLLENAYRNRAYKNG